MSNGTAGFCLDFARHSKNLEHVRVGVRLSFLATIAGLCRQGRVLSRASLSTDPITYICISLLQIKNSFLRLCFR